MSRSEAADRFYSRWAKIYDHLSRRTPGIAHARQRTVQRMGIDPEATVVDMGCGPGPNFAYLRDAVGPTGRVIGIDVAGGALTRGQAHIEREGWDNVHVVRGDATEPPVRTADAVVSAFVIGMFDDPGDIVDRWCDQVGTGGRIGLLHFAQSDRSYARLPNLALDGLVLASTPGKRRMVGEATTLLDRRVREGHATLIERSAEFEHSTHWGGVLHIVTATVC